MGSGKIVSIVLAILGIICFGMYFVFNVKSYTVTFDSDGGSVVESQIVKDNELAVRPSNPTKDGYEFIEWDLNGVLYNFQTAVNKDITLKAVWKQVYNIVAVLDNNEYTAKVLAGEKLDISNFHFPEREGYIVKLYDENNKEYDLNSEILGEVKLKADYVALKSFTVKFDSAGADKISDLKVWEGSLVTEPTITRNGYTLEGWYLGNDMYDFNTPVNSNITLKAKWNENGKLTVTFESDGKVYKKVSVLENSKVSKPDNPTKSGYIFVDWMKDDVVYNFNDVVTEDITIVASFRKANKYKVTFDSDNGENANVVEVLESQKVSKPTDPTKGGYIFIEWQLNDKAYNFDTLITSNITLKAKWVIARTVTFNSNGGSDVEQQIIKDNDVVIRPANPTRSGYRFLEWQLNGVAYNFNTKVTSDITLNALWRELEHYTVTFDYDNGNNNTTQNVTEGDTVTKPTDPTKEGYTFVEWQLNGNTYDFTKPVTSNITLKAKYEEN